MGLRAARHRRSLDTEHVRSLGPHPGQERLLELQSLHALRQIVGRTTMISRFHARVAVLSMVAALAVSTLSAAQGEVATGTAATCSPVTGDVSAAQALAWGAPTWCAEFDDAVDQADWVFYDSPGHAGNGRRSPEQLYLGNGALYLYGRPDGTTAGLATKHAQTYGRWETRVRLYPGAGRTIPSSCCGRRRAAAPYGVPRVRKWTSWRSSTTRTGNGPTSSSTPPEARSRPTPMWT